MEYCSPAKWETLNLLPPHTIYSDHAFSVVLQEDYEWKSPRGTLLWDGRVQQADRRQRAVITLAAMDIQ